MAQPRTFQFYGVAYGNSPVTITASINSTQIFSGTVHTIDQPFPDSCPNESDQVVLFTINDSAALNTDFAGSLPMTLVVSGGTGAWVEQITCNYHASFPGYIGNRISAGNADGYAQCYYGNPTNSEGSLDPRSNVVINGVAQTPQRPPNGTWGWGIPTGETMTHNFNIGVGSVANVVGNTSAYTGDYADFLKS
jgi:hypothetical protein